MARAALGWSTVDLAEKAQVGVNTVNRIEAGQDARMSSVDKLTAALRSAGVELIDDDRGIGAVRLKSSLD